MATIGLVSLGCDKNVINAQQMLYRLAEAGYEIGETAELCEVVIINTCSFIEAARSEAVENILEIAAARKCAHIDGVGGNVEHIIVTGCLAEQQREELLELMPEVDAIVGCGSFDSIVEVVEGVLAGNRETRLGEVGGEYVETPRYFGENIYTASLKIAEGCSNNCAYCVIPKLRGRYRSRSMDYILAEANDLAEHGVVELTLVAQDLTMYGADIYGERKLPELIDALCKIENIKWLRLLYLYPEGVSDELIACIKRNLKVVRYLDIPVQHINDGILHKMNRRTSGTQIRTLFERLRTELDGLVLRTSIIAGLPGEGDAEFDELYEFLESQPNLRAGYFAYSPEEGTPAALMERPDDDTVAERMDALVSLQYETAERMGEAAVGREFDVLFEGTDTIIKYSYGRTYADAPDVDGKVFFPPVAGLEPGSFVKIRITEASEGDLFGVLA